VFRKEEVGGQKRFQVSVFRKEGKKRR